MRKIIFGLFIAFSLIMTSCYDNSPYVKGNNGKYYRSAKEGTNHYLYTYIDTIIIHGKSHEFVLYTDNGYQGSMCHSPECWCLKKEIR